MTKLYVRPATQQDCKTIADIAAVTGLFPPEMLDDMMAGYLAKTSRDIWYIGAIDAGVVSFGFCEPERMTDGTWNLLAIGVLPEHQGRGYGAQMMTYLESRLAAALQRVLIVETMGTPEFARTRQFYRKNGYIEEARIREFYEAGGDKIVFWKHL